MVIELILDTFSIVNNQYVYTMIINNELNIFKSCPCLEWSNSTWQESPEIVKAEPTTRACDRPSLPADRSPSFRLRFDVISFNLSIFKKYLSFPALRLALGNKECKSPSLGTLRSLVQTSQPPEHDRIELLIIKREKYIPEVLQ